jgi:hypothetical protein
VGIGAQKLDTIESHPARLREDAQQPDMSAAIVGRTVRGAPLDGCAAFGYHPLRRRISDDQGDTISYVQ